MSHVEPTYYCVICQDEPYGWCVSWCRGTGNYHDAASEPPACLGRVELSYCGRMPDHKPHTFAEQCRCLNNPVREAHQRRMAEAQARRATAKAGARR